MNLPFFVARRYFLSRKSQRVINIISMISVLGVIIGTAALIVVLSVFNGFESLVIRLYNSFDPDLTITATTGKSFNITSVSQSELKKIKGVRYVTEVLEEYALVKYRDKQTIVTLKGVSNDFEKMTGIDSMIVDGRFKLHGDQADYAVVGGAIAYNLQLNLEDYRSQLEVFIPRAAAGSLLQPEEAFNRRFISASGIFAIQQEFDAKYVLVPLHFVRDVLESDSSLTSLEVGLAPGADIQQIKAQCQTLCGNSYTVRDRYELHELIYKIMKSERWAVYLILTFILIIATFNVISSLTMLVIEKKKDIAVLHSMGAGINLLRKIFLNEGLFITMTGAVTGLVFGFVLCYLQSHYGLIRLGGSGSFVIDSYPVHMQVSDFIYVFLTVFVIGLLAAWYPARRMIKSNLNVRMITNDE